MFSFADCNFDNKRMSSLPSFENWLIKGSSLQKRLNFPIWGKSPRPILFPRKRKRKTRMKKTKRMRKIRMMRADGRRKRALVRVVNGTVAKMTVKSRTIPN